MEAVMLLLLLRRSTLDRIRSTKYATPLIEFGLFQRVHDGAGSILEDLLLSVPFCPRSFSSLCLCLLLLLDELFFGGQIARGSELSFCHETLQTNSLRIKVVVRGGALHSFRGLCDNALSRWWHRWCSVGVVAVPGRRTTTT